MKQSLTEAKVGQAVSPADFLPRQFLYNFAAALVLLLANCSNPPKQAETSVALPEAHVDPATAGTISGRVLFQGAVPQMPVIDMSSNPSCERQHKSPVKSEAFVLNKNGTLRNAFVWIKDGLPAAHWTPPAEPVKLTQSGCIYEPHVLGIMVDQRLAIYNDDPVNHNVHADTKVNAPWNIAEAPKDEPKFRKFASPEVLFPMTLQRSPLDAVLYRRLPASVFRGHRRRWRVHSAGSSARYLYN